MERRNFFSNVIAGITGLLCGFTLWGKSPKADPNPSPRVQYPPSDGEPFRFDLGDVHGEDRGDLGIDIRNSSSGKKVLWLNQASELAMLEYLQLKYPQGNKSPNVLLGNSRESKLWPFAIVRLSDKVRIRASGL